MSTTNTKQQMSETHLLGLLLALVGGFWMLTPISAEVTYLPMRRPEIWFFWEYIFTNGDWSKAFHYFMPVLAFVLGILICEMIQSCLKWKQSFHWRQAVVFLEFMILVISGFLPLGPSNAAVNIMVSFVCALQVEAFRKMNGNTFATTMCTGNLRSATENLYLYTKTRNRKLLRNSLQYYNVILFFILGAAVGGFLTLRLGKEAVWISCVGLVAVFFAMFRKAE